MRVGRPVLCAALVGVGACATSSPRATPPLAIAHDPDVPEIGDPNPAPPSLVVEAPPMPRATVHDTAALRTLVPDGAQFIVELHVPNLVNSELFAFFERVVANAGARQLDRARNECGLPPEAFETLVVGVEGDHSVVLLSGSGIGDAVRWQCVFASDEGAPPLAPHLSPDGWQVLDAGGSYELFLLGPQRVAFVHNERLESFQATARGEATPAMHGSLARAVEPLHFNHALWFAGVVSGNTNPGSGSILERVEDVRGWFEFSQGMDSDVSLGFPPGTASAAEIELSSKIREIAPMMNVLGLDAQVVDRIQISSSAGRVHVHTRLSPGEVNTMAGQLRTMMGGG